MSSSRAFVGKDAAGVIVVGTTAGASPGGPTYCVGPRSGRLTCWGLGVACACCEFDGVGIAVRKVELKYAGDIDKDAVMVAEVGGLVVEPLSIELCLSAQLQPSSEDSELAYSAAASEDEELDVSGLAWRPLLRYDCSEVDMATVEIVIASMLAGSPEALVMSRLKTVLTVRKPESRIAGKPLYTEDRGISADVQFRNRLA